MNATRRLLPEAAAAAVPGAVLVARPTGTVRHLAVPTGPLTGTGRLRHPDLPLCRRAGRAAWHTGRGVGRPLCRTCEQHVRSTTPRDSLIGGARTLTATDLVAVLEHARTLDQVDTVAGLLAADPQLRTSMHPAQWGQQSLQALVRQARERLTPPTRPAARAPRGTRTRPASAPAIALTQGLYPTRLPRAARRAS